MAVAFVIAAAPAAAASAPGAPGAVANWTAGDKDGFGTSTTAASHAWFTLADGELSEVCAPDLGTPSLRDLQFVVSDGATFSQREREDAVHTTTLADPRSLTYRQISTTRAWRITKTYVTDPARSAVLVDVSFESLTGRPYALYVLRGSRHLTLALAFAATPDAAAKTAAASLRGGFAAAAERYAGGWHDFLGGLPRPRSVAGLQAEYDASLMVLAASEDKTHRGAFIAAPAMPWVWGNIPGYSGPYHEVADPILLSWQLRRFDAATWEHMKAAAGCILANGPVSQERWENAQGYSPASIAAEIAGLICAADIAERIGDAADAAHYRDVADTWQRSVEGWTVTTTGPLSAAPYFLRLTADGQPDAPTTYTIGDGGPTIDQRAVVDPSFLELVRLGVEPAGDPAVVSSLPVVDRQLGVSTPNGTFWHRYNYDGYGETLSGGPFPGDGNRGRLWPIFAGERGEYELAAGQPASAAARLRAIAATANDGRLLTEQVWDDDPPPGATPGTGTFSATPLGWTHAQLIRLAWSLDAGRPVERPAIVACRYAACG